MQETCKNPCIVANPCTPSQRCVVTSGSSAYKSVACICPEGTLAGYGGTCENGMHVWKVFWLAQCMISLFQLMPNLSACLTMTALLKRSALREIVYLHVNQSFVV